MLDTPSAFAPASNVSATTFREVGIRSRSWPRRSVGIRQVAGEPVGPAGLLGGADVAIGGEVAGVADDVACAVEVVGRVVAGAAPRVPLSEQPASTLAVASSAAPR
jgi:hypothetical protein